MKAVMLAAVFASVMVGCSEEVEDPTVMRGTADMLGVLKTPDTAPGAPQLIPEGTPTVKSVGYYSDWQMTKKLTGSVSPGKTIFIKVEFSEGMKLVVADDKKARPILYYRVGKELTRFRIAGFGAKGEDFVSGDAKPVKNQKMYLGKYTVQPEDTGQFVVAVGKWSVDREGNTLPAFYTHKEKVQLGRPAAPQMNREEPKKPEQVGDTVAPTILSIEYYLDSRRKQEVDAEAEFVPDGTDIYAVVRFSEAVTPVITYTTGNSIEKRYTLSQQRHGVHWRGVCKPIDTDGTSFVCYAPAREDAFSVTVTAETADLADNRLAEAVTAPTLEVRPAVVTDPVVVEVPDPTPPDPVAPTPPQTEPTEVFGTDLVGRYTIHNAPEEIRSLFSILNIHADIEIVVHGDLEGPRGLGGYYKYPTASVYRANHLLKRNVLRILAAELFHAHQYTIAGGLRAWEQTPEGVAYLEAERKDFAEVGKILNYDRTGPSWESASSLFSRYWGLHYTAGGEVYRHIQVDMPNRYKWFEQRFGR